mgnify:CR=1 FL=1|tara:strand:- start:259 stop:1191 length:933 start_codon:yes stop_codon:yes gene_type:complete
MAILSKGTDFTTGDQVTAAKLDALVDNATFASDAVDGVSTALDSNGKIIVKDGGITSAKLASVLTSKVKITNDDTAFPNNLDGGLLQLSTTDASSRASIDSNELLSNDDFTIRVFNGKSLTFAQVNSAGDGSDTHARIDSTGDFLVGATSQTAYAGKAYIEHDVDSTESVLTLRHVQAGDRTMMAFVVGSSVVGRINEASGTISLVQGSDYRLKEDIADMNSCVDKVKLLKPRNYALKSNGVHFDGFIAHELNEVCPQAVFGEKDAVDEKGNPLHQGIDQTKLIPMLTKALQESLTKIESLEARVTALES